MGQECPGGGSGGGRTGSDSTGVRTPGRRGLGALGAPHRVTAVGASVALPVRLSEVTADVAERGVVVKYGIGELQGVLDPLYRRIVFQCRRRGRSLRLLDLFRYERLERPFLLDVTQVRHSQVLVPKDAGDEVDDGRAHPDRPMVLNSSCGLELEERELVHDF